MAHISIPKRKIQSSTFDKYIAPLLRSLPLAPELVSRGDRPLKMTFVDQILSKGQTGVIMDRGYQSNQDFDLLQGGNKHLV